MSLSRDAQFWLKPIDNSAPAFNLSDLVKSFKIHFTANSDIHEPARPADSPHPAGTPEHNKWVRENVIYRQLRGTKAYEEAKAVADERIAKVRNAWGVRRDQPTFAYGKTVDDLIEFIESDRGPLVADFADGQLQTGGYIPSFNWDRLDRVASAHLYGSWLPASTVQGILGSTS